MEKIVKNNISKILISLIVVGGSVCSSAFADGMLEDTPVKKKAAAPAPVAPAAERPVKMEPVVMDDNEELCEWKYRLSPAVPVWFFEDEDTRPAAGLYIDAWRTDLPWNFRVGVEGRHMNLDQDAAQFGREWIDKTTRVTYMRIPFAVEYMDSIGKDTTWFIGGGPDIIHLANDISETDVGGHIGTRLHYGFNDNWGVSLEAGYMWARLDGEGDKINLDGAYVTPALAYTF